MPGRAAILRKEGSRLIIEPVAGPSLLAVLAKLKQLDEEFPPVAALAASNSDMPVQYLLDTSTLSHLIRQPQGPVAERIAEVGGANVLTSVVVACELRYGAAKRGSRRLTKQSSQCSVH